MKAAGFEFSASMGDHGLICYDVTVVGTLLARPNGQYLSVRQQIKRIVHVYLNGRCVERTKTLQLQQLQHRAWENAPERRCTVVIVTGKLERFLSHCTWRTKHGVRFATARLPVR